MSSNRKRDHSATVDGVSLDGSKEVISALRRLFADIYKFESVEIFLYPVDQSLYPEYYEVISNPKDFDSIKRGSIGKDRSYSTLQEVLDDIEILYENACTFNEEGSDIYNLAADMKADTDRLIQKYLGQFLDTSTSATKSESKGNGASSKDGGSTTGEKSKSDSIPGDVRNPHYWPQGKDSNGSHIGEIQLPKRLFTSVLRNVKEHKSATAFLKPLPVDELPGYLDVVEEPMDLETLGKTTRSNAFQYVGQLVDKLYSIFDNCMAYNAPGSDIYVAAQTVRKFSEKLIKRTMDEYMTLVNEHKLTLMKKGKFNLGDLNATQQMCYKILKKVLNDERSEVFKELDEESIPGYVDAIENPIDLVRIQVKLPTYTGADASKEFLSDLLLVFDNAMQFNIEGSNIHTTAKELKTDSHNMWMKAFVSAEERNRMKKENKLEQARLDKLAAQEKRRLEQEEYERNRPRTPHEKVCDTIGDVFDSSNIRIGGKQQDMSKLQDMMDPILCLREEDPEGALALLSVTETIRDKARENGRKCLKEVCGSKNRLALAPAMYDICNLGEVSSDDSRFWGPDGGVLYPDGYKVARVMRLAVMSSSSESGSSSFFEKEDKKERMAVPYMDIETYACVTACDEGPLFTVCLGNKTVISEAFDGPREVWMDALCQVDAIVNAVGSKFRRCRAVFNRLCCEEEAIPFLEKLELEPHEAEHYYNIIKAPIWLRLVHERLLSGAYDSEFDFAWDIRTMFTNCMAYNLAGSDLHEDAKKLMSNFDMLMCAWVLNPHDISVSNLAQGPWDDWQYLRYFDEPNMDGGKCVASGEKAANKDLLQCAMCESQYLPAAIKSKAKPNAKNWKCSRCNSCTSIPEDIKNDSTSLEYTVEAVGGIRYTPASSLGAGWCQALEEGSQTKRASTFLSPLGYIVDSKEGVSEVKLFEKDITANCIEQRHNEFHGRNEDGKEGGEGGSPARPSRTQKSKQGVEELEEVDPHKLTVSSLASYKLPRGHQFQWLVSKDDDTMTYRHDASDNEKLFADKYVQYFDVDDKIVANFRDSGKFYAGKIQTCWADGTFAVKYHDGDYEKRVSLANIRKASNYGGHVYSTNVYLGLEELTSACCVSSLSSFRRLDLEELPLTGFYGLHFREVQLLLEGGLDKDEMVEGRLYSNQCRSFEEMLHQTNSLTNTADALKVGEDKLFNKLMDERDFWEKKALEDRMSANKSSEINFMAGPTEHPDIVQRGFTLRSEWDLFFCKDAKGLLKNQEGELLLCVWDFLEFAKDVMGDAPLCFEDIKRSIITPKTILPELSTTYFDEVCLLMTKGMLREARIRLGYDGTLSLNSEASEEYYTTTLSSKQRCALDLAWQDHLLYKPTNALTWPAVMKQCLLVTSQVINPSDANRLFKFPGVGHDAIYYNEIMCLMCKHPMMYPYLNVEQIGVISVVSVKEDDDKGDKVISDIVPVSNFSISVEDLKTSDQSFVTTSKTQQNFIAEYMSHTFEEIRSKCTYQHELFEGHHYLNPQEFVDDVCAVLISTYNYCEGKAKAEGYNDALYKYSLCLLNSWFLELLEAYGMAKFHPAYDKNDNQKGMDIEEEEEGYKGALPPSMLEVLLKKLTEKSFSMNAETLCASPKANPFFSLQNIDLNAKIKLLGPEVFEHEDERVKEQMQPGEEYIEESLYPDYFKRLQELKDLKQVFHLLRTTDPENFKREDRLFLYKYTLTQMIRSDIAKYLHERTMKMINFSQYVPLNVGAEIDLALSHDPKAFERTMAPPQDIYKTSTTLQMQVAQSGQQSDSTALTKAHQAKDSSVKKETFMQRVHNEIYNCAVLSSMIKEVHDLLGETGMEPLQPYKAIRKETGGTTCYYTEAAAYNIDPKYKWVHIPAWLLDNPSRSNFSGVGLASTNTTGGTSSAMKIADAEEEEDASVDGSVVDTGIGAAAGDDNDDDGGDQKKRRRKSSSKGGSSIKSSTRKNVSLEYIVILVAACRLAAIKKQKETGVEKLFSWVTDSDKAYVHKRTLLHTGLTADIVHVSRAEPLGVDSANWSYWVLCAQDYCNVAPMAQFVQNPTSSRGGSMDHEPNLLIRTNTGHWISLPSGSAENGLKFLLQLLEHSSFPQERNLKNKIIRRLAYTLNVYWFDGPFKVGQSDQAAKFYKIRFDVENELQDEADTMEATGSLHSMDTNSLMNVLEQRVSRCTEVRTSALMGWMRRVEDWEWETNLPRHLHKERTANRDMFFLQTSVTQILDYHPSRGFMRTDTLGHIIQSQPSLVATRMHFEPYFADWVRYSLRNKAYTVSQEFSVGIVGLMPPSTILTKIPRDMLRQIWENPGRHGKEIQKALHYKEISENPMYAKKVQDEAKKIQEKAESGDNDGDEDSGSSTDEGGHEDLDTTLLEEEEEVDVNVLAYGVVRPKKSALAGKPLKIVYKDFKGEVLSTTTYNEQGGPSTKAEKIEQENKRNAEKQEAEDLARDEAGLNNGEEDEDAEEYGDADNQKKDKEGDGDADDKKIDEAMDTEDFPVEDKMKGTETTVDESEGAVADTVLPPSDTSTGGNLGFETDLSTDAMALDDIKPEPTTTTTTTSTTEDLNPSTSDAIIVKTEAASAPVPPPTTTAAKTEVSVIPDEPHHHSIGLHYSGIALSDKEWFNQTKLPSSSVGFSQTDGRIYRKPIECLHLYTNEVLRIFESGTHAADYMGMSQSGISLCCNGRQDDAYGFKWRWYDDKTIDFDILRKSNEMMDISNLRAIVAEQKKMNRAKPRAFKPPVTAPPRKLPPQRTMVALPSPPPKAAQSASLFDNSNRGQYYVKKPYGIIRTYNIPRSSQIPNTPLNPKLAKPQFTATKVEDTSIRLLRLKTELINLMYILPERPLNFDSFNIKMKDLCENAAKAHINSDRMVYEIREEEDEDEINSRDGQLPPATRTYSASAILQQPIQQISRASTVATHPGGIPKLPVRPRPPVELFDGPCPNCTKGAHCAHTRLGSCKLAPKDTASLEKQRLSVQANHAIAQREYELHKACFLYFMSRIEGKTATVSVRGEIIETAPVDDDMETTLKLPVTTNSEGKKVIGHVLLTHIGDGLMKDGTNARKGAPKCASCRPARHYACGRCRPIMIKEGYPVTPPAPNGFTPSSSVEIYNPKTTVFCEEINVVKQESEEASLPVVTADADVNADAGDKEVNPVETTESTTDKASMDVVPNVTTTASTSVITVTEKQEVDYHNVRGEKGKFAPLTAEEKVIRDKEKAIAEEKRRKEQEIIRQRAFEKKEKKRLRRAFRKGALLEILSSIQKAKSTQELLQVVVHLEETIPYLHLLPYHKYAASYTADSAAEVANRIFVLDRVIRYENMKEIEKTLFAPKFPFTARTQTQLRCMASPLCCGPLWHSGRCHQHPSWYFHKTKMTNGLILTAKSRQPNIIDTSGELVVFRQGATLEDDEIQRIHQEFNRKKAQEAQEMKVYKNTFGRGTKRGYGSDEESFDSRDGKKKEKKKLEIDIEYVVPYRPKPEDLGKFYDV